MVINDIWGPITIEPQYEKIIDSKEFKAMKDKTQLGLNSNPKVNHTRYYHSLGTYYLACRLIEICKEKFSELLKITKEDEEAIKCMALVHDIGHGCFSHVSEKFLEGTHEQQAENMLLNPKTEINQAIISNFGEIVLQKTIDLIKRKETTDNNLMLIIGKLLSGGIDIDRLDYIYRDSKYVTGEINDYFSILEKIELEHVDDSLEVVFDEDTEYKIANFFNKRFELYDSLYFHNHPQMLQGVLGKFLEETKINFTWETTEKEMNQLFLKHLSSSNEIIKRYAYLLNNKTIDDNFVIKEINDLDSYNFYKKRVLNNVPELKQYKEVLFEENCKISIYDKSNKIFINKQGLIQDISETSKVLNSDLTKEKYLLGIDLKLLKKLLKYNEKEKDKVIKKIKKLMASEIEQEKKYTFLPQYSFSPDDNFNQIKTRLNLTKPQFIENNDTYYDDNDILDTRRIAVRKRVSNEGHEWTIKRPLKDKSSITKREEKNFSTFDETLSFLQKNWKIPLENLKEKVTLKTSRTKYNVNLYGGLFEIVFDKTTPFINQKELNSFYMVECELKDGNSAGLYFINKIIKEFKFIEECKFSKKELALQQNEKERKSPFLEEQKIKEKDYNNHLTNLFKDSRFLLEELKKLEALKDEIQYLRKEKGPLTKPFVITLCGTPRAGKTTCVDNLFDFFKKANLKTRYLKEPAGLIYDTLKSKEEKQQLLKDRIGFVEQQYEMGNQYINNNLNNNELLLCDRGILDTFIWYDMYYQLGMIDKKRYKTFLQNLKTKKSYYDYLFPLFTDSYEALKRDHLNSLSLEPRTTMNQQNIKRYNNSLLRMYPLIKKEIDFTKLINTSESKRMEPSIIIANDVLSNFKKLYLGR